ncbi:MAG: laccase domain-containing protein [Gemmatimonadetes bacterium]|nr:laccase domain-containing protein [Gemmatimonadota bacterium]
MNLGRFRLTPVADWDHLDWLLAGTVHPRTGEDLTARSGFGTFTETDRAAVDRNWLALSAHLARPVVLGRQVHGAEVLAHRAGVVASGATDGSDGDGAASHDAADRSPAPGPEHDGLPGLRVAPDADGHATDRRGLVLSVTVADCVPVYVVDPVRRSVAILHAGWRGVAGGVAGRGIAALAEVYGSRPPDLLAHLGPAICGSCYEVGPEVFDALAEEAPDAPAPIDLRGALSRRLVGAGVAERNISVSRECTHCGPEPYFSHRAGHSGRNLAVIGVR